MTIQNEVPTPAEHEGADLATRDDPRYPVPDPGHEEHLPRLTDVDEKAADRATRQVATFFGLVPLLAIGFVVVYFAMPGDVVLRLRSAARQRPQPRPRPDLRAGAAVHRHRRRAVGPEADGRPARWSTTGTARPPSRRTCAWIVDRAGQGGRRVQAHPAQGDRPQPDRRPGHDLPADARRSRRPRPVADQEEARRDDRDHDLGRRRPAGPRRHLRADQARGHRDRPVDQRRAGEPRRSSTARSSRSRRPRRPSSSSGWTRTPSRSPSRARTGTIGGILCYSKICTHVGCPISLWEQQTHHLLCPCHQSTFDLGDSGVVVFGPAARALPQLPITTDAEGYLVARRGFDVPTGPSYFERDSRNDFKEGDN